MPNTLRYRSLRYDFDRRVGKLHLRPGLVADARAVINLFTGIDTQVESVVVMCAGIHQHVWTSDEFPRLLREAGPCP